MRSFAVIEDDSADALRIKDYITHYSQERDYKEQPSVALFSSAEDFLTRNIDDFDVVFLDINLPGMDGLTCAKKIRESNSSIVLVFISSLSQFAIRGYEVDALDYVLKPVIYSDFVQKLTRVFKVLDSRASHRYLISLPDGMLVINPENLMYIEVIGHTLTFHLRDRIVTQYGKLSDMEKAIAPFGFIRCNRCYLVNPRYVDEVHGNIVTVGGDQLSISRSQKQPFLHAMNVWLMKGGR
ncbi:MAG: response regulator transcription factor [Clostridia bacterium]|nr:response regulator transcription factor [Clostridia bacterium]